MSEKHQYDPNLRVRTDKGKVAHMARPMYDGGFRTLCGRNIEPGHMTPHLPDCWPCWRRAQELKEAD